LKSFSDLDLPELRRAAVEDLAVDIRPEASKDEILAEFLEQGITWQMYAVQHPELAEAEPEPNREQEPNRGNVVTATSQDANVEATRASLTVAPKAAVGVQEPPNYTEAEKYLVKMERENILFDNNGYRFTQEHPYALVANKDVDDVLEEDGFRLATPGEAREFYS
jgi:hypothetical protein